MKILHFEIKDFKPMMYCGNSSMVMDVTAPVVCFIGNNGSGKSTVLRELTPLPALSTDYTKKGMKKLTLLHSDSEYVVSSVFSKTKGSHSFVKDGVELNDSGTSGVQTELCELHFGMVKSIKEILSGVVKICSKSRADRRQFLLSCYPSDMSFVLQHFKKISSEVRGIKSNIRMLNGRLIELEHQALPEGTLNTLSNKLVMLDKQRDDINHVKSVYETVIESMQKHEMYDHNIMDFDFTRTKKSLLLLNKDITNLKLRNGRGVKYLDSDIQDQLSKVDHLSHTLDRVDGLIQDVVDEIDKFEKMSDDMSSEKVLLHTQNIESLEDGITKLSIDTNLPLVNKTTINFELLKSCCESFGDVSEKIVAPGEFHNMVSEATNITASENSIKAQLEIVEASIKQVETNMNNLDVSSFRDGCVLACSARQDYESILSNLLTELLQHKEHRSGLELELVELIQSSSTLIKVVKHNTPIQKWLEHTLSVILSLGIDFDKVLGVPTIDMVNNGPMTILTTVERLCSNTIEMGKHKELSSKLEQEKLILNSLVVARNENTVNILEHVATKSCRLSQLREEYAVINNNIKQHNESLLKLQELASKYNTLEDVNSSAPKNIIALLINKKIIVLRECIKSLDNSLNTIEAEKFEVRSILKDKEGIQIRIDDEIKPSLIKSTQELEDLLVLESVLSPSSGLPHVYMVRFLNNLINYTNKIIGMVWNYEMELVPPSQEDNLDFSIKIKLHSSGTLKDISMLSDGQKEMVDLAFTIALFKVMGLGNKYPIKLDEVDAGLTTEHRTKLLSLFGTLLANEDIGQLLIVNHHSSFFSSFNDSQIVCLDPNGIVTPHTYNQNVEIT